MINSYKIIGFVCECNPFHKGHIKLINEAKKYGDILIAVMSGNFVQRGEPAVFSKEKRAKELIENGVDLVIEMPLEYTLSSAKYFAYAGVNILNKLKFVDYIIFGSENGNLGFLKEISNKTNLNIKNHLKKGISYPKAMEIAYDAKLKPNDILGVEYLNAIKDLKSKIKPLCIKRDTTLETATELREKIVKAICINSFTDIFKYKILLAKNNIISLDNISNLNTDIKNAILNNIDRIGDLDDFSKILNTKNRTQSNIKRAFLNIILNVDNNIIKESKNGEKIKYINIIASSVKGKSVLKYINIPFMQGYTPYSFKSILKNFKRASIINENNNKSYNLSSSIKIHMFADNLYNILSKKNSD